MLSQLSHRQPGYTLSRPFYTDPDYYRLDLDHIWHQDWVFAGHDCELATPGALLTLQVGDYPVLLVRGRDGAIRAFHNSCRHRGSRLCATDHGTVSRLKCPYHQWTYELDGRLVYARDMPDSFDPAQRGLKPVHCAGVGGYLFVCVAPHAPEFSRFRAQAEPYLAPHRLTEAKVAFESTIVEQANWKLVWENNRECYHCSGSHPELCRVFPEKPTVGGLDGATSDPDNLAHWQRCEAAGLPSRFVLSEQGQFRTVRMPLLRDTVSYTMSGRAAVRRPLSESVREDRIGSMLLFHYPSTWNHVLGDHALTFRVLPLGPTQTQVTTKWLVHKDAVEGADYDLGELTKVWLATNAQDQRIVEENQRGVGSPAFEPGPYSMVHESGVAQFVDWYAGAMERSLGGARTLSRVA
jgi:Rieske 2Fe-2S family protein